MKLALGLCAAALAGALWWYAGSWVVAPWSEGRPPATWAMLERYTEEHTQAANQRFVPLTQLALELQMAVIVGEDFGFFHHGAVDLSATREALEEWWSGRRTELRGGSTLTQ